MADETRAENRLDVASLSDDEIASRCHDPGARKTGNPEIRGIVRISDDVAVKCGWSVTAEEAANLELAYKCSVAGNIVRGDSIIAKKTNVL